MVFQKAVVLMETPLRETWDSKRAASSKNKGRIHKLLGINLQKLGHLAWCKICRMDNSVVIRKERHIWLFDLLQALLLRTLVDMPAHLDSRNYLKTKGCQWNDTTGGTDDGDNGLWCIRGMFLVRGIFMINQKQNWSKRYHHKERGVREINQALTRGLASPSPSKHWKMFGTVVVL